MASIKNSTQIMILRKLSFYTLLLLLIPITVWLTGWGHWSGDQNVIKGIDYPLYWLTETGSVPYALVPCVLFMLWLMWLTRRHYSWLLIGVICATSVIGTQAIKTGAKLVFSEPRPYVNQMMESVGEQPEQFYKLSKKERASVVATYYKDSEYPLIVQHRVKETGYSFPSGHTIFAVSWILLFVGLTAGIRSQAVVFAKIFVIVWGALMLISRLRLGMHYPIDLFASTLIAWFFHSLLFMWIIPQLQKWTLFRQRG